MESYNLVWPRLDMANMVSNMLHVARRWPWSLHFVRSSASENYLLVALPGYSFLTPLMPCFKSQHSIDVALCDVHDPCSQGYHKMMFTTFQSYQLESWFETNNELDQSRAELFAFVLSIHDPIRVKMWFRNKQLLEDQKKVAEDSKVLKSDESGLKSKRDDTRQEKRQVRHDHCDFLPNCLNVLQCSHWTSIRWYFLSCLIIHSLADEFTIV